MNIESSKKILKMVKVDYERIALSFSDTRNRVWAEVIDLVNKYIKEEDNILEVGCGNGRLYDVLKDRSVYYTGVDQCENFIKIANQKYKDFKNINFLVDDALDLSVTLRSFDFVFLLAVLNHFPTRSLQKKVLQNIYNSLKPGGILIMTNWNLWRPTFKQKSVWKFWLEKIKLSEEKFFDKYDFSKKDINFNDIITLWGKKNNPGHLYYCAFTIRYLTKLIKEVGFVINESFYAKMGKKCYFFNGNNSVIVAQKLK